MQLLNFIVPGWFGFLKSVIHQVLIAKFVLFISLKIESMR